MPGDRVADTKCGSRGCPWPAVKDGLCGSCWDLQRGQHPDVSPLSMLAEAAMVAAFKPRSAERGRAGGRAAQRAWGRNFSHGRSRYNQW